MYVEAGIIFRILVWTLAAFSFIVDVRPIVALSNTKIVMNIQLAQCCHYMARQSMGIKENKTPLFNVAVMIMNI